MSAPFRRHSIGADAGPPDGPAPWSAGRRLDVPNRMAPSMGLILAKFSAEVGGAVPEAGNDPALCLVMNAIEASGDRSAEDMVADAIDRLPWTDLFMDAARERRRWDALWWASVEAARRASG